MDITQIQQPLTQFLQTISAKVKVKELIIFGSYLEGTVTEGSDVDVVVVSPEFNQMDEDQRLDILYEGSRFIKPDIHPWGFTPEELQKASHLTPIGYVRDKGFRFPVTI